MKKTLIVTLLALACAALTSAPAEAQLACNPDRPFACDAYCYGRADQACGGGASAVTFSCQDNQCVCNWTCTGSGGSGGGCNLCLTNAECGGWPWKCVATCCFAFSMHSPGGQFDAHAWLRDPLDPVLR